MLEIKQPSNGLEEYNLNNLKLFHPLGEIALNCGAFKPNNFSLVSMDVLRKVTK
jgi:hypothetical protein